MEGKVKRLMTRQNRNRMLLVIFLMTAMVTAQAARTDARATLHFQQTDAPASSDNKKNGKRHAEKNDDQNVRSVTIPVTTQTRDTKSPSELQPLPNFVVLEDGSPQQILSVRGANRSPLSLAVLVQDDVVQPVANDIKNLADFVRLQPRDTRVMIGYIRAGSLQIRQKFTTDMDRAARNLRIPISSPSASPYNPYVEVSEALKRFDSQPQGRRAILIVSDGLDVSRGADPASVTDSPDLLRAIREAQQRGVAVYAIYAPTVGGTARAGGALTNLAQSALNRLCDETGGRAFFQGTGAPVNLEPFLRAIAADLSRQLAVTYLSTNTAKGFHRIEIKSLDENKDMKLAHPSGYAR
jgi:VWFA-related protein